MAFVVLDLTPVPHLDATAVRMLLTLVSDYRAQKLQLALSNPSERVFAMMERSGLLEVVGAHRNVDVSLAQALGHTPTAGFTPRLSLTCC